jgi:hypothetical protein
MSKRPPRYKARRDGDFVALESGLLAASPKIGAELARIVTVEDENYIAQQEQKSTDLSA